MKEKCKDAARNRREKERAEFIELAKLLPLPMSITRQLDKASIIRLTSSYLKLRDAFPNGLGKVWGCNSNTVNQSHNAKLRELGSLLLQTLDGFVFAMHCDGKVMYVSETVSVYLGLPQIELTGSNLFEFVHNDDCAHLVSSLMLSCKEVEYLSELDNSKIDSCEFPRAIAIRLRCVLPKRNAGLVSNNYKVVHCHGYLKARKVALGVDECATNVDPCIPRQSYWQPYALVGVGQSVLPSASTEIKLNADTFIMRLNMDATIAQLDTQLAASIFGYKDDGESLIQTSLYQLLYGEESSIEFASSHKLALSQGQALSSYLMFITKNNNHCVYMQLYMAVVNSRPNGIALTDGSESFTRLLQSKTSGQHHIVVACYVLGSGPLTCPPSSSPTTTSLSPQIDYFVNDSNADNMAQDYASNQNFPQILAYTTFNADQQNVKFNGNVNVNSYPNECQFDIETYDTYANEGQFNIETYDTSYQQQKQQQHCCGPSCCPGSNNAVLWSRVGPDFF